MKPCLLVATLISLLFLCSYLRADALNGPANADRPAYAPDLIEIKLSAEAYARTNLPEGLYAEAETFNIEELDQLLLEIGGLKIIRAYIKPKDTAWEQGTGFDRCFLIRLNGKTSAEKAVRIFKSSALIENTSFVHLGTPSVTPNDYYYYLNWGHHNTRQLLEYEDSTQGHTGDPVGVTGFDCDADLAWNHAQAYGATSVIIAIIDSGVDTSHPDLRLVAGYDLGSGDADPAYDPACAPGSWHGTAVAGIAAGIANNWQGVTGVAGGCSIMPLKIMNSNGNFLLPSLRNALIYAADYGADLINVSIGWADLYEGYNSLDVENCDLALEYAYAHGLSIFSGTGNFSNSSIDYPANHNKVIAVGAAAPDGARKSFNSCDGEDWWGSNYGSTTQDANDAVDLMAPTILPSTDIMGADGYTTSDYCAWFSGTSCSSPYAAGVAALLLSQNSMLTPSEIRTALVLSAQDMTIDGGVGWDRYTGYGMVNAYDAVFNMYQTWDGSASTDWNDPDNWSEYHVPSAATFAIIPPGVNNYPVINTAQKCRMLNIQAGAQVNIVGGSLTINTEFFLYGSLIIDLGTCTLHGEYHTASGAELSISNGNLTIDAPTGAPPINNTVSLQGVVSVVNSQLWVSPKSLTLATDPASVYTDSYIYVAGNFFATDPGCFHPTGVNIYMYTGIECGLNISNGNWINNIYIFKEDPTGIVHLNAPLAITGDFALMSGRFHTHGYGMTVAGNWTNNVSPEDFVYSTSTVTFNGSNQQDITGNNWFYNVFCQNTMDTVQFWGPLSVMGNFTATLTAVYFRSNVALYQALYLNSGAYIYSYAETSIASYHGGGYLGVLGGTINIIDLADAGLYGSIRVQDSHLVVHQDPAQYLDLNGWLSIQNGIVDIYGGSGGYYIGYNANATLNMDSGELNFKNQGVYVGGHGPTCDFNISGGIIRVNGNWYERSGVFDPIGGTVEFTGSVGAEAIFETPGGWFWGLRVNKPVTREDGGQEFETCRDGSRRPITRNREMTFQACTVKGGFQVIAAYEVYLIGDMNCLNANSSSVSAGTILAVINNASFTNTGNLFVYGILMVAAGSSLKMSLAMTLGVYDGGALICLGNSSYPALITHNGTGYYGLSIESGGTLGAEYTIFEYMNGSGVYIKPGASVASEYPLNHCTFRNGSTYWFSYLLRIDNAQEFTITGAYFPTNAGAYTYNIAKTVDSGIVYFANWSGYFGGPSHEYDPHNHVYWQNSGIPPVMNLTISYTASTNRVHLNWTYPLVATSYNIYRGLTPDGTFTLVDNTSANTWSEVVPGNKYFYRVTAIMP